MSRHTRWVMATSVVVMSGCGGPSPDDRYYPSPPPPDTFALVSPALEIHCGTLDCHGSVTRNWRLNGFHGARLDPSMVTGDIGTTDQERLANWESTISIQPEILSAIYAQGGARPERWILITKGRQTERHKGGRQAPLGSDPDLCLVSWLTGTVDEQACNNAAIMTPPDQQQVPGP